jgi:hypothetical protein
MGVPRGIRGIFFASAGAALFCKVRFENAPDDDPLSFLLCPVLEVRNAQGPKFAIGFLDANISDGTGDTLPFPKFVRQRA